MLAAYTPLLAEGRFAQLDLGLHGCVDCRITGFAGPEVYLHVGGSLPAAGERLPAYLLLEDANQMQAVRGHVQAGDTSGSVVLRLTDHFPGQRRLFSRAPLVLRAHVCGLAPGAAGWDTFTRDLSAGGVRLGREPGWDGSTACEVTLTLREDLTVAVGAEIVRVYEHSLGLRFTRIEPGDRALLAELAVAFHRAR